MSGDSPTENCHTYRITRRGKADAAVPQPLDLAAIREHLGQARGREYWRSLEEAAESPAVQDMLHREFPSRASEWNDPVGRRDFLRLMGASLALAGVGACTRQPDEHIVPYVRMPEHMVPGKPLFFATAMTVDGYATGLLVESHTGRPTKIEGNPSHPASLGATDVLAQASILSLYDPDRSHGVTYRGEARSWEQFLTELQTAMAPIRQQGGKGLRILTEPTSSPTLIRQMQELLTALPQARWYQYAPVNRDSAVAGARLAFGSVVEARYHFDKAETIVSLDADFLDAMPGNVRYARDFVSRRKVGAGAAAMNRLYVIESTPSITGARADHRLSLRTAEVERFSRALVARITGDTGSADGLSEVARHWVDVVARDLLQHRGTSLLLAGPSQPPAVHALVHVANQALGNNGSTVDYLDPIEANLTERDASLRELVAEIDAGAVTALVIVGANPAYTAPADVQFGAKMAKAGLTIAMGTHADETGALAQWHLPETHFLEEWSDARAFDGTASVVQPLIAPLYDGHSVHELVAALGDQAQQKPYQLVRDTWQAYFDKLPAGEREAGLTYDRWWRRVLNDGVVPGTARQPRVVKANAAVALPAALPAPTGMELIFRPDPAVYDGRFANNGWLQELPKPTTKLTWDNAALVSPRTAERLGIEPRVSFTGGEHGQTISPVVELKTATGTLRVAAWVTPGQPDDCVTLHLGNGRSNAGRVGNGVGVNANLLRTSAAPLGGGAVEVTVTGDDLPLASTQAHHSMEGRDLVRSGSLEEYRKDPTLSEDHEPESTLSMYPETKSAGYAWAMTIDLSTCIGCNACVVGCQSENNIPVVGKKEVLRGREMHWLRIDRYHTGSIDAPDTHFQPVPCMHCEDAPCETVCPVNATVHSEEGLNEMVYNRCVGTRYCSNNCPYKVRRFNFFLYDDWKTPAATLARNPDVSVRSRGVMEKCTYCVQRISSAKIDAEKEGRLVRDGEITTACQAVCPTNAIEFGNMNDPRSRVSQLKSDPRNYGLLAHLNTRPRTTYLADVRNPNPEL